MSRLGEQRIGFIGAGAMAEALIGGLLASGARADQLCAVDPDPERREFIAARHGVRALSEAAELRDGPRCQQATLLLGGGNLQSLGVMRYCIVPLKLQ